MGVHAEVAVEQGQHVLRRLGVGPREGALGVGGADHAPALDRPAGQGGAEDVGVVVAAGGPVKGGRVVGASDAKGAFPKANPKTPQDVLATLYRHLGVDPGRQYLSNAGRPVSALPGGKPVEELF